MGHPRACIYEYICITAYTSLDINKLICSCGLNREIKLLINITWKINSFYIV